MTPLSARLHEALASHPDAVLVIDVAGAPVVVSGFELVPKAPGEPEMIALYVTPTHWYQISPETKITCVCARGKDHGDEGYNVPPEMEEA